MWRKTTLLKNGQRNWIDIFPKKTYQWPKGTVKESHWWSMSSIIRKMQINATMSYHFTPVRIRLISKRQYINNNCWGGCGEKETLVHWWWERELEQPLWKIVQKFLKKNKNKTAIWSINPISGYIFKGSENRILRDIYTPCSLQHYSQ